MLVPNEYRIIGSEESPYSVKVRSYFRYKALPHQWLTRTQAGDLFQTHAKLPLVPLVVTPDERGMQDSTPIIEQIESAHPDPSVHPDDPICRFVSTLLEEFGDEWGNKWMFHYRWAREVDQLACSRRLAGMMEGASDEELETRAATIRERMVNRVWFVGSSAHTAQQIEESFKDTIALVEAHLAERPYLFGARPAFGDFGLWGQLYNAHRDPTPRAIIEVQAPNTLAWINRMSQPTAEGDFEPWSSLAGTLKPLLRDQVADLFLPWSNANAQAIAQNSDSFSVTLRSGKWEQKPQKYHAKSLQSLQSKYQAMVENPELVEVMTETGCHEYLTN